MIGDSLSDIQAAKTAIAMSIGYANKPHKHDRMLALNPDAIVDRIEDLIPRS
ncbi:HAD family hydrolase [Saccharopolyspora terrae]|nr:HAD hydrolase-like protein [Saccharopolyspora terrae]